MRRLDRHRRQPPRQRPPARAGLARRGHRGGGWRQRDGLRPHEDRGPALPGRHPATLRPLLQGRCLPSRGQLGMGLAIAAEHAALLGGTLTAANRDGGGPRSDPAAGRDPFVTAGRSRGHGRDRAFGRDRNRPGTRDRPGPRSISEARTMNARPAARALPRLPALAALALVAIIAACGTSTGDLGTVAPPQSTSQPSIAFPSTEPRPAARRSRRTSSVPA